MIPGFMDSEKRPLATEAAKREADVYDLLAWLEVNKNKVAIVAVALVALGFLVATMRYFGRQKEANASAELLALKPALVQNTNTPPPQASGFLKVAEEFKGTSAAERARLLAGSTLFTEGRYADAEREFSAFLAENQSSPWAASAAYGVAAAQEAAGKASEAQASYQQVVTGYPTSAVVREAKLALARIYETRDQPDQALRIYNELSTPPPGAQFGQGGDQLAAERKEALLRRYPNLEADKMTAAPAAAPAVSTNSASTNAAPAP